MWVDEETYGSLSRAIAFVVSFHESSASLASICNEVCPASEHWHARKSRSIHHDLHIDGLLNRDLRIAARFLDLLYCRSNLPCRTELISGFQRTHLVGLSSSKILHVVLKIGRLLLLLMLIDFRPILRHPLSRLLICQTRVRSDDERGPRLDFIHRRISI